MFMASCRNSTLLFVLVICCFIVSCTPSDQSQIQTLMAPAFSTAAADAEKYAKTQAVSLGQTAIASGATEVVNLKETSVAAAKTQVSSVLTPQPPNIDYKYNKRDIILYNVVNEISVSEVAFKFSVSSEQLINLNREKYPSITDEKSKLEPEWRLVLYIGSPDRLELIPDSDDAWQDIPGCIESQIPMISVVTCNEYTLDFSKEKGMSIGCVALDGNPFGYYVVHSRYQGLMLFYSGDPFVYSLYFDEEKNSVVIGPVIIKNIVNLPECGIPGNP